MTVDSVAAPRFDWYAATINVGVDDLRDVLCRDLGGSASPEEGARHGFQNREVVRDRNGNTLATILHGGNGDIPHAYASSDYAHGFAGVVRQYWPARHRVSRMDAAVDFDNGSGTFDTLLEICRGIADGAHVEGDIRKRVGKVKTNQMGDWHHAQHGRTFYLGAFKSAVLARLYEKGIQLREDAVKRGKPAPVGVTDNAVRLEVQVRPDGDSKRLAATATPESAFGYAEWSRELYRRVEGAELQRVDIKERRDSDHERAMQWMVKQYGAHLLIDVARLGSWEALGADLRRRLETGEGAEGIWLGDDRPF